MKIKTVSINHVWKREAGGYVMDQIQTTSQTVKADTKLLLDLPQTVSVDVIISYKGHAK